MEDGIEAAMSEINATLGVRLAGIVLDLRNNPGGLLDQSLVLADSFLEKGEIVSVRGRDSDNDRSHKAESGDLAGGAFVALRRQSSLDRVVKIGNRADESFFD